MSSPSLAKYLGNTVIFKNPDNESKETMNTKV